MSPCFQLYGKSNTVECTNSLVLHACEDNVEHLCERGLSGGLVDEVAAGQVDVVAGSDGEEHRALMNLYVRGGHRRQQGLDGKERGGSQSLLDRMSCSEDAAAAPAESPLHFPICGALKPQKYSTHTLLLHVW